MKYFFLLITILTVGCSKHESKTGTPTVITKKIITKEQQIGYVLGTSPIEISRPLASPKLNQISFSQNSNVDTANLVIASFKLPPASKLKTSVLKIDNIGLSHCDAKLELTLVGLKNKVSPVADNGEIFLSENKTSLLRVILSDLQDCKDIRMSFSVLTPELELQEYERMASLLENNSNSEDRPNQAEAIFFTANWCGPCKMISPIFKEMSMDRSLIVHKVSIDNDYGSLLFQHFGGRSIPTTLFVKGSNVSKPIIGATSKSGFEVVLDRL